MPPKPNRVVELRLEVVPEAAISGGVLVKTDYSCFLTFNAARRTADGKRERAGHAVVRFKRCIRTLFGHPNDEALPGHPLYRNGLEDYGYGIFEVLNSTWIREIERENRVKFPEADWWTEGLRHFIFTFHDSTFECVAEDFTLEVTDEPYEQIFARISKQILSE